LKRPVSTASVVEATMIDFSCAPAGPGKDTTKPRAVIKASVVFRAKAKSGTHSSVQDSLVTGAMQIYVCIVWNCEVGYLVAMNGWAITIKCPLGDETGLVEKPSFY
jgi:hypothetical protein